MTPQYSDANECAYGMPIKILCLFLIELRYAGF
jgi:hypothetical protein